MPYSITKACVQNTWVRRRQRLPLAHGRMLCGRRALGRERVGAADRPILEASRGRRRGEGRAADADGVTAQLDHSGRCCHGCVGRALARRHRRRGGASSARACPGALRSTAKLRERHGRRLRRRPLGGVQRAAGDEQARELLGPDRRDYGVAVGALVRKRRRHQLEGEVAARRAEPLQRRERRRLGADPGRVWR